MKSIRLVAPPLISMVISAVAVFAATAGLLINQGPVSIAFAALAALLVWRLLGLSVQLEDTELVVRNTLRTFRFPVDEIDIRARVVDPRLENYAAGATSGYPEIPTASDDNTVQAAKWYMLEHGKDRYFIDALMGRSPANHERLAWELRQQLLSARGIDPGDDSEDRI